MNEDFIFIIMHEQEDVSDPIEAFFSLEKAKKKLQELQQLNKHLGFYYEIKKIPLS